MSEPIEKARKGKKSRRAGVVTEHRSRRVVVYQNRNKPVVSDITDAIPHFDDDLDECAMPDETKAVTGNAFTPAGRTWLASGYPLR